MVNMTKFTWRNRMIPRNNILLIVLLLSNAILVSGMFFSEHTGLGLFIVMHTNVTIIFLMFILKKDVSFISAGVLFNIFGWLYVNYHLLQIFLGGISIGKYDLLLAFLALIAIIFFNLGYLFRQRKTSSYLNDSTFIQRYNLNILFILLVAILVLAIAIEAYLLFVEIGFRHYIAMTRSSRSLIMAEYSGFSFYSHFMNLVMIISLYSYFITRRKSFMLLFIAASILSLLNSFMSVSRASMIMIFFPILYLLRKHKKINDIQIIMAFGGILIVFGLWKGIFSQLLSQGTVEISLDLFSLDSELLSWYNIGNNILGDLLDDTGIVQYLYGRSYVDTLRNLVVPFTNVEPLSRWYLRLYEYEVFQRGGGRGFSIVIEAFLNYSYLGVVIVPFFYGWLYRKLHDRCSKSASAEIGYMILSVQIYRFFRAESLAYWKTMYWFLLLPTLMIFLTAKMIKQSN